MGQGAARVLGDGEESPWMSRRDGVAGNLAAGAAGVAVLMAVVLCLGMLQISRKPFWLDEIFSIHAARLSPASFIEYLRAEETHMAPYYLLLQLWRQFGETESRLRLLSVVFGVVTVPVLYWVGREMAGRAAGLAACVVYASNAALITYLQEVRGYTLLLFLLVLSTALMLQARKTGRRLVWCLYVVVIAAAVWTHLFAGFVLVVQVAAVVASRPQWRTVAFPAALLGLLLLPLAGFIAFHGTGQLDWVDPFNREAVASAIAIDAGGDGLRLVSILALVAAGLLSVSLAARAFLAAWIVTPFLGATLVSVAVQPIFVDRYLIVAMPAFALLAGVGLTRIRRRSIAVALAVALIVVSIPGIAARYVEPFDDWRSAAAYVATNARDGDVIVYYPWEATGPFGWYYDHNRHATTVLGTLATAGSDRGRVWIVFQWASHAEQVSVRNQLGRYTVSDNIAFGGVRVQLAVPR